MKRYIIEDNYGQDITAKVTLAVKNAEIRVIDENGTDITSKIQFKEIVIRHYEAGQRDAQAGFYDKWYRYNAKDGGYSYEKGWLSRKRTDVDYQIIEG
ncbi:MAG: hypothetical protein MJZ81_06260 [Bacteroidales bacterium]|nr:hypothetical protein [Bacteroidales bacterium]